MSNEEKILQMLADFGKEQAKLREQVMKQGILVEQINKKLLEQNMKQMDLSVAVKSIGQDVAETRQLAKRTAVLLETDYADKLQLLFDGHTTILETLAPKSRVEALEDDVSFMKTVIKALSQEIAELKKAQ